MQELTFEQVEGVSGGSVGDYWGTGSGTPESRSFTSCERGLIGGAIAGAAGGVKTFILGILGGGFAGGCGQK